MLVSSNWLSEKQNTTEKKRHDYAFFCFPLHHWGIQAFFLLCFFGVLLSILFLSIHTYLENKLHEDINAPNRNQLISTLNIPCIQRTNLSICACFSLMSNNSSSSHMFSVGIFSLSFSPIPSDIKTHKIDFHYCHRVFLFFLSKEKKKKFWSSVFFSVSRFFLSLCLSLSYPMFWCIRVSSMKRKAVRLANAKIYIFFMCRTEREIKRITRLPQKTSEEKERRRVVKTRTVRVGSKTRKHFYKNHLVRTAGSYTSQSARRKRMTTTTSTENSLHSRLIICERMKKKIPTKTFIILITDVDKKLHGPFFFSIYLYRLTSDFFFCFEAS
jgi:hypothetical protein